MLKSTCENILDEDLPNLHNNSGSLRTNRQGRHGFPRIGDLQAVLYQTLFAASPIDRTLRRPWRRVSDHRMGVCDTTCQLLFGPRLLTRHEEEADELPLCVPKIQEQYFRQQRSYHCFFLQTTMSICCLACLYWSIGDPRYPGSRRTCVTRLDSAAKCVLQGSRHG